MFSSPAYAQAAGAAGQNGTTAQLFNLVVPMLLMFVAFYFLLMRPQQRRAKALQDAIAALRKGDQIIAGGGLIGKVVKVEDNQVEIELAPNVRIRALKSSITEVLTGSGKPAND